MFHIHLVKKGLVERPTNEVIHIGEYGKPSKEIMNEYKYSVNPIEATVSMLRDQMVCKSKAFINHQGYRMLILEAAGSLSEIVVEVMHHDFALGVFTVGIVLDRTLDAVLNEEDLIKVRSIVEEMVCIKQQPPGISIGRLFIHLSPVVK
jgi:hypothetical protein